VIWLIAVAAVAVAALIVYRLGHKRLAVVLGVVAGLLAAWLLRARQRPAAPPVAIAQAKAVARCRGGRVTRQPVDDLAGDHGCDCDGDCDCA
jgi:membrane protein implicated in regulation of membrane protease activity